MKKAIAGCILILVLAVVYVYFQPGGIIRVENGKCLPVSVREIKEEKLSNLQCVDIEGWEANILVPHVQGFIASYPDIG